MQLETGPDEDTSLSLAISSDKSMDNSDPDPDSALGPSEAIQTAPVQEMSFRPLDLSETRSTSQSSNWSQNDIKEAEINNEKADENPQNEPNLQDKAELFANVGAKVTDYLNKMRTDKRFQISLASLDKSRELPDDSTKMSFNTDLDSTTLTETKFRQGLESSIDLSDSEIKK